MTNWAIVAIPKEDDPVWAISSEKVPHMTILSLGNQTEDSGHVQEFIDHAVKTSLTRFGMSIDRRGELGPDKADVYFFNKSYVTKELAEFRGYLLTDESINKMYNSTAQYTEWTPHLTLGYPAAPAKTSPLDYPLNWVEFDRIALWINDFAGPEFILPTDRNDMAETALSMSETMGKVLKHHGIKGMRWGVRRSTGSDGLVSRSASEAQSAGSSGSHAGESSSSGHSSADHEKAVKALAKAQEKGHSALSNEELKQITNRIKAQREFTQLTTDQHAALQAKVNQLRLEKEYRQLSSEAALARRSTGRKMLDAFLKSTTKAVSDHAASAGEKMVKDMLKEVGVSKKDLGVSKPGGATKGKRPMPGPFRVNPDKVRVNKTVPPNSHNLPTLLKRR